MVDEFSSRDVQVAAMGAPEIKQSPDVPTSPACGAPVIRAYLWLRGCRLTGLYFLEHLPPLWQHQPAICR